MGFEERGGEDMWKLPLSPRRLLEWARGERVSGVHHLLALPGACTILSLSQPPRRSWDGTEVKRSWEVTTKCGLIKGASYIAY